MSVSAGDVQILRAATGAGIMDAKKALTDANGDHDKAAQLLEERGVVKAAKKGERKATEGVVHAYIHGAGKIGVLLELNCETDFVARGKEFKTLANDLAMHIAAMDPQTVESSDSETALLAQPFIKDPRKTVEDVLKGVISQLGENIRLARFTRYQLGDA